MLVIESRKALDNVHEMFDEVTRTLQESPKDLSHLNTNINLLKQHQASVPDVRPLFEPIRAQYELLGKFDLQPTDEENAMLQTLEPRMLKYEEMLGDSEKMLRGCKNNMKRDLESGLDSFKTLVVDLRKDAQEKLPYGSATTVAQAEEIIAEYESKVEAARAREKGLQDGLEVFAMASPDPEELIAMEEDLSLMKQMWGCTKKWDDQWDSWKNGRFSDLDVDNMELAAGQFNKTLVKLGRSIKGWGAHSAMKGKIDQFRQTLPLIMDLRNPTMRERHWTNLMTEINKHFDPHAPDFTLEKVFALGLVQAADFIGEMSANANKEFAIETALQDIAKRWGDIDIDIVEYKEVYFKVRSTEDLFAFLEDDQVAISTMKASKFYHVFKENLDLWDHNLSHASEVVEMMLTVQRQWMYLESIFMASEDIRKQLPTEAVLFDEVNTTWKRVMGVGFRDPNCLRVCAHEDNQSLP